ncbi:MAG TPA: pyridoxamine 5'-phosphate oxidase family protein [Terriglobales bacterium]|nr:pyridoxamine 5'-phosphate oxidase family protein [Terriglobales bacterium]
MSTAPKKPPRASRPHMPGYGIPRSKDGLLPWTWAAKRLENAHTYWLATTRPNGQPHAMPVWCVWLEGRLFFSTGRRSRKARNLARDPRCSVGLTHGKDSVILEGKARRVRDAALARRVSSVYSKKYDSGIPAGEPVYGVEPQVAFGFTETGDFLRTATRWKFG